MSTMITGDYKNKELLDWVFPTEKQPSLVVLPTRQPPLDLHAHEFEELVIVSEGNGMHLTETDACMIQAGDVFVIHPFVRHGYGETKNLRIINVLYRPDKISLPFDNLHALPGYHALFCVEPHYRKDSRQKNFLHLETEELRLAVNMLLEIQHEMAEQEPGFEIMVIASFAKVLCFLSRSYAAMHSASHFPAMKLGKVLSYLEEHFSETVTLPKLCRMAGMSKSTLWREFHKVTGFSPIDYLLRLRIFHASEMLRMHKIPVTEVAWQAGFKDSNYFSRQYRRIMGETPAKTRKKEGNANWTLENTASFHPHLLLRKGETSAMRSLPET